MSVRPFDLQGTMCHSVCRTDVGCARLSFIRRTFCRLMLCIETFGSLTALQKVALIGFELIFRGTFNHDCDHAAALFARVVQFKKISAAMQLLAIANG